MRGASHITSCFAAGIIGFAAAQFTTGTSTGDTSEAPPTRAELVSAAVGREVASVFPGVTRVQAIARIATDKAARELEATSDPRERSFRAARIFLGYYLVNTRARPAFCHTQGVDIGAFVDAFTRRYASAYARAGEILSRRGVDQDMAYSFAQPALARVVDTEMQGLRNLRLSDKEVCATFVEQADRYLDLIDLHRRQPDIMRHLRPAPVAAAT